MARLSVNLNKIALLRNSRHTGVPDVLNFARIAHEAGADGLTVHPRPDERHIRRSDVPALAAVMHPWRPQCELNIEGYPDERLRDIVREVRPEQCTLVPDPPGAFTSEEGWKLDNRDVPLVNKAVAELKRLGCRGIEIYTGNYAAAFRAGNSAKELQACATTAARARERGLVVNAGHDLNLENLPPLVAAMPFLAEASIGHELTADALVMGFAAAVKAYKAALTPP
jgi:pyridoxine 5-phosphate synthase